jgi:hypothetical protein
MKYKNLKTALMKEIILIMQKKLLSVLFIFALLFMLCACTMQTRSDFSELLLRTQRNFGDISLEPEDAFFSDGEWFLFVSLCGQDDLLLTATEDENRYVTSVGISTIKIPDSTCQKQQFVSFCVAAARAFTADAHADALLEELGIYDEALIFSEEVRFSEKGRYSASFFNADMGSTVRITIE